jgi:hypothetical protein
MHILILTLPRNTFTSLLIFFNFMDCRETILANENQEGKFRQIQTRVEVFNLVISALSCMEKELELNGQFKAWFDRCNLMEI